MTNSHAAPPNLVNDFLQHTYNPRARPVFVSEVVGNRSNIFLRSTRIISLYLLSYVVSFGRSSRDNSRHSFFFGRETFGNKFSVSLSRTSGITYSIALFGHSMYVCTPVPFYSFRTCFAVPPPRYGEEVGVVQKRRSICF